MRQFGNTLLLLFQQPESGNGFRTCDPAIRPLPPALSVPAD
jgi:hypothetical protein